MATFPANIPWSRQTSSSRFYGVYSVKDASGRTHVQVTATASEYVDWDIKHVDLSQVDLDAVNDFLRGNRGVSFSLVDPSSGKTYDGYIVSDLQVSAGNGGINWDASWRFQGTELTP